MLFLIQELAPPPMMAALTGIVSDSANCFNTVAVLLSTSARLPLPAANSYTYSHCVYSPQ
jgi:hypothetical protein